MTKTHLNHHIHGWLEKIQVNVETYKATEDKTNFQNIDFITHQYHLVMLIYRALDGQVIFAGAKKPAQIKD